MKREIAGPEEMEAVPAFAAFVARRTSSDELNTLGIGG